MGGGGVQPPYFPSGSADGMDGGEKSIHFFTDHKHRNIAYMHVYKNGCSIAEVFDFANQEHIITEYKDEINLTYSIAYIIPW